MKWYYFKFGTNLDDLDSNDSPINGGCSYGKLVQRAQNKEFRFWNKNVPNLPVESSVVIGCFSGTYKIYLENIWFDFMEMLLNENFVALEEIKTGVL